MNKNIKASLWAGASVIGGTCEAISKKTSQITSTPRHAFWDTRARELDQIIADCGNCKTDRVATGCYVNRVKDHYCDDHRAEASKIIYRWNKSSGM